MFIIGLISDASIVPGAPLPSIDCGPVDYAAFAQRANSTLSCSGFMLQCKYIMEFLLSEVDTPYICSNTSAIAGYLSHVFGSKSKCIFERILLTVWFYEPLISTVESLNCSSCEVMAEVTESEQQKLSSLMKESSSGGILKGCLDCLLSLSESSLTSMIESIFHWRRV